MICTVSVVTTGRRHHLVSNLMVNSDFPKLAVALFLHLGLLRCCWSGSAAPEDALYPHFQRLYIVFTMFYSKVSVTKEFHCVCLLLNLCPNPLLMGVSS